jgi:hypothetical protein
MKTDVVGTAEFEEWFNTLNDDDTDAVIRTVGLLEARGVTLGHPYTSALHGTRHPLRELRVQSQGHPLRILSPSIRHAKRCCCLAVTRPATTASTSV